MANIGNLVVKLQAQTAAFKKGMADARQSVTRFADAAKRQADRVKSVFGALGGVVKAAMGALAAYGLSLAGISVAITRSATAIDQLAKHADKLGIAVNELQFLRFAADQTGVSMQSLDTGLQRMTRRVAEAAQGTGAAKNALEELGLSASQLNAMSPDQQFQAIARAMGNISNQGDKVRLAMQIFDTEGVGLVNTMAANLEDLRSEFDELGLSLTRSQAAAVESFNDSRSKLAQLFDGIRNHVTASVAPALQVMIDKVVEFIKESGGIEQIAQNMTTWMLTGIQKMVQGMQTLIEMINEVKLAYNTIIGTGQVAGGIVSKGVASVAGSTPLAMLPGMDTLAKNADMLGDSFYSVAQDTAAARIEMLRNAQRYNDRMQSLVDSVGEAKQSIINGFNGGEDAAKREADIAQWRSEIAELQQQIMESPGKNVAPILEQIRVLRDKIASSNEPIVGSNDKNTEATNRNTAAMLALAGKSGATAAQKAGVTQERVSTTAGGKQSAIWDQFITRFRTIAGTSRQSENGAQIFASAARTLISRFEGVGGYDTDKMRQQMEEISRRMGDATKEGMKEAAQELTGGEGQKSIGSITITVKSDKGETSGDVTGDTAFLSKLASTLQSVSTAV